MAVSSDVSRTCFHALAKADWSFGENETRDKKVIEDYVEKAYPQHIHDALIGSHGTQYYADNEMQLDPLVRNNIEEVKRRSHAIAQQWLAWKLKSDFLALKDSVSKSDLSTDMQNTTIATQAIDIAGALKQDKTQKVSAAINFCYDTSSVGIKGLTKDVMKITWHGVDVEPPADISTTADVSALNTKVASLEQQVLDLQTNINSLVKVFTDGIGVIGQFDQAGGNLGKALRLDDIVEIKKIITTQRTAISNASAKLKDLFNNAITP
jgi:hypothetical protein